MPKPRGRPAGEPTEAVQVRMPRAMREELQQEADKRTLPLATFIRLALREWLDAAEQGKE